MFSGQMQWTKPENDLGFWWCGNSINSNRSISNVYFWTFYLRNCMNRVQMEKKGKIRYRVYKMGMTAWCSLMGQNANEKKTSKMVKNVITSFFSGWCSLLKINKFDKLHKYIEKFLCISMHSFQWRDDTLWLAEYVSSIR